MSRKIATVKDWKLMQEGKQFIPVNYYSIRRLKDGVIFELGVPHSFKVDEVLIITEFNLDLIHVTYRVVNWAGTVAYSQKMPINNLSKSTNAIDGVYAIQVKVKRAVRRRRSSGSK